MASEFLSPDAIAALVQDYEHLPDGLDELDPTGEDRDALRRLLTAVPALLALAQAQTWQPISPQHRKGDNWLVWDTSRSFVATWNSADFCWVECGTGLTLSPSHAMPLPACPPSEAR